jgi:arabinofuranosyltransferase
VHDARAALACAPLADLERATRAPLTVGRFFSNIAGAFTFQRLRIPGDPTDAAEKFCGIRPPPQVTAGGPGGNPYRWRCPEHMAIGSVVVTLAESEPAFTSIEPHCRAIADGGTAAGPPIGTKGNRAFDIVCPPGTVAIGFHGHADTVVHEVGLVCATPSSAAPQVGEPLRTRTVGKAQGDPFQVRCPDATVGIGLAGRIGALLDAIGAQCGAP